MTVQPNEVKSGLKVTDLFVASSLVFQVVATRKEVLERWKASMGPKGELFLDFEAVSPTEKDSVSVTISAFSITAVGPETDYKGPNALPLDQGPNFTPVGETLENLQFSSNAKAVL